MIRPEHIKDLINQITKTLGLTFIKEQELESNVCFAKSKELRDDYKTSFTSIDLLDYIYSVLHSTNCSKKHKTEAFSFPYPKDADIFWESVKLGNELKQTHLLEVTAENKNNFNDQNSIVAITEAKKWLKIIDEIE